MKHTTNVTKITNHHNLISNNKKQFIALLHQLLGHQDGLKQAYHNGIKRRASPNEHFDISYA